ncbi:hypothetical protein [Sulfurimonas sediminis]|uniref:hypothetical protein n=1 Tax=Sulfurimonas sediminis TaxID=2590020 RepID=UPI00186788FA|nr:hypothetical protein [Sulfurimonas sediminis]
MQRRKFLHLSVAAAVVLQNSFTLTGCGSGNSDKAVTEPQNSVDAQVGLNEKYGGLKSA